MPIYEYECQKCGRHLEALQRVSEPPLTTCPDCKGELKKLLSAPAFQFKGSGWYVTDYAGKGKGGDRDSSASKAEGGGGKEGGEKAASGDSKESGTGSKSAKTDT